MINLTKNKKSSQNWKLPQQRKYTTLGLKTQEGIFMREIYIKSMGQWQIVVKEFNFVDMFDTLEEGRKAVAELYKKGK